MAAVYNEEVIPEYNPGTMPTIPGALSVPNASVYTDQYVAPTIQGALSPLGTAGTTYVGTPQNNELSTLTYPGEQYDPSGQYSTALGVRDTGAIDSATAAGRYEVDYNKYLDPATATVSAQLDKLLQQSNPYIDRARKEAEAKAASAGMLSSSMAMGAAEGAAIDRALPIAQADANTYAQFGLQGLQGAQALSTQGQQGQISSALQGQAAAESAFNVELNAELNSKLKREDTEYSRILQKEQAGYQLTAQEEAYKQNSALELERSGYTQILQKEAAGYELTQQEAVFKQNAILNQQAATDAQNLSTLEGQINQALEESRGIVTAEIQSMQDQAAMQRTVASESAATARANTELASLESRFNIEIAADERANVAGNIATLQQQAMTDQAMINIRPDDEMSATAKAIAIQDSEDSLEASINAITQAYGWTSSWEGNTDTTNTTDTTTTTDTADTTATGKINLTDNLSNEEYDLAWDKLKADRVGDVEEALASMNTSGVAINPRGAEYGFVFVDNTPAVFYEGEWMTLRERDAVIYNEENSSNWFG